MQVTSYDINGQEIDNTKEISFAEHRFVHGVEQYLIAAYNHEPFNPSGTYSGKVDETILKKVNKDIFDYYILFLQTKSLDYLHRVRRGMLDG